MKLVMLLLQDKEILKRGECFHITMLTNTVTNVTFGDLRAEKEVRLFFNAVSYFKQSWTFFDIFIHLCTKDIVFSDRANVTSI